MPIISKSGRLLVVLAAFALAAVPARSATLHAILVATSSLIGSGDADISQGSNTAAGDVGRTLHQAANAVGMTYQSIWLSGDKFTALAVNTAVDQLAVTPDDVVVFWYGGHGLHDPKATDSFPSMYIPSQQSSNGYGAIQLVEIRQRLLAKHPRLTIVIFDSCSDQIAGYPKNPASLTQDLPWLFAPAAIHAMTTLLAARGEISMAAAKVGQTAWVTDNGGFFTEQLVQTLRDDVGKGIFSWQQIAQDASQRIDDHDGHQQQPVALVELK